eukprot:SAG31_NODE_2866_length_4979_cov_3.027869_6_plen_87_part_00
MEPYLEKAQRTGRLIVPSKLGCIPDETYSMKLHEISLAGNMLKTLDTRLASVCAVDSAHPFVLQYGHFLSFGSRLCKFTRCIHRRS